ncbi:MAG: glycosyltransferase family 39 protein [Lentisphaeraceae bacterium]|nr:glycosyltransferase family 39 protein [Lentisphaeraceae bacterium]
MNRTLKKVYNLACQKFRSKLCLILLLATILRISSFLTHPYIKKDSILYLSINHHIVNGNIDTGVDLYHLYPPSMYYLMKWIYLSGLPVELGFRCLAISLSIFMLVPFYLTTRSFVSERSSIFATFLLAIHPKVIEYSHAILRDSIAYPSLVFGVAFICYAIKKNSFFWAALGGVLFAITHMARIEYGLSVIAALLMFVFVDVLRAKKEKIEIDLHTVLTVLISLSSMIIILVIVWFDLDGMALRWDPLSFSKIEPYLNQIWK